MSSQHWVSEPNGYLEPKVENSGYGSVKPRTVIEVFQDTVAKHGDEKAMALKRPVNGVIPSEWQYWTWKQYWDDCVSFAKSLLYLKVSEFGVVNIIGFNSPEWLIANCGSMVCGCISAGVYTSNTPDACYYVSNHSKAEVIVLEDASQLAKYTNLPGTLSNLKAIVIWTGEAPADCGLNRVPVYSWAAFMKLGSAVSDEALDARGRVIRPGNCASLIYTSGTTGNPKAVMISHDNITWTANNICTHYMDLNHKDRVVSYLPLSHIAAQLIDIYAMIQLGACCYFCQTDALRGSLTTTMKEVEPTIFFAVPRVWEKIQEKMAQIGRSTKGALKVLSTWAKAMGTDHSKRSQYGAEGGAPCSYSCAKAIVLKKIQKALGLAQVKGAFTAAAPIAPETLWYFASLDLPVYEVFGQSECTGPHTVSFEGCWKLGTCGRPMKGTKSKIVEENGELCYSGRHIFMGYMYMPEQSASTIDEDGYLHSGDVAVFDADHDLEIAGPSGFMSITGRIKELIITAGGENVPPVLIENEMKAAMPAVSNCMVIGDKKKFLSLLVSLKVDVDLETQTPTEALSNDSLFVGESIGSKATTYSEAKADPLWNKYVDAGVQAGNSKTTSNAQKINKWAWLPIDFSEKAGDLTPTLKLKRSVVAAKYEDSVIREIYGE